MTQRKRGGASLPCPKCHGDSEVVWTKRMTKNRVATVIRERACKKRTCKHRFRTREEQRPWEE